MNSPLSEKNRCEQWEAAVADLHDGTLRPEGERALREHAASCENCGPLLHASERGRLWARLLHDAPPEPPLDLFGKILARTDALPLPPGFGAGDSTGYEPGLPAGEVIALPHPASLPGGHLAARWLMTGTMALFSLALTASVSGVHPGQLRAAAHNTLHGGGPASLQGTASRQFFDTKKQVVSFYDNLRLVREVESRVDALRLWPGGSRREPRERWQPSARLTGEWAAPACLLLPLDPEAGKRNRL